MSPERPVGEREPFEAFSHRGMYHVAFAACVALLVGSVGVLLGAWWPEGPPSLLRFLPSRFWGALGVLYFGGIGSNLVRLMRDPRPALLVSEKGVLNRTYLSSSDLVPWQDVLEIRPTYVPGVLGIVLRDVDGFRQQQSRVGRLIMRVTELLKLGPFPVHTWQLRASRDDVSRHLYEGLEAFELESVRETRLLDPSP